DNSPSPWHQPGIGVSTKMTIQQHTSAVRIVEVGPRDGLQTIHDPVPTMTKLHLIQRLYQAGLRSIELTSAVSPKVIPQLADCRDVLASSQVQDLLPDPGLHLPVLVPNTKGLEIAAKHSVREVAVFVSATEGFSRANINCTVDEGIQRAQRVIEHASILGIHVRGYVSCIFSDPYDGPTPPSQVLHCVKALLDAGCYEVSLGDTLGIGSPSNVRSLVTYLTSNGIPASSLAGHFHDTYGQAVANVWEAYGCGIRVFDSSVGGLGGCPFAPGAKGNVASEDVVYMFHNAGIATGIDLPKLVHVGDWISKEVGKPNSSRVEAVLGTGNSAQTVFTEQDSPARDIPTVADHILTRQTGVNIRDTCSRPRSGNELTASGITDLTGQIDSLISRIIHTADNGQLCDGIDLYEKTTDEKYDEGDHDQMERLVTLIQVSDSVPED
ncbi:hypothetical protein N7492_008128, partial [Penicillium capsulatum]